MKSLTKAKMLVQDIYNDNTSTPSSQFTFIPHMKDISYKYHHVYVDGSYDTTSKKAGWGFVIHKDNNFIVKAHGHVDDSAYGSRNITGEIMGAIMGLRWADYKKVDKIIVMHDYTGLGQWAAKLWKTKAPISKKYIELLNNINCSVEFRHVKGHSGNEWNDMADKEAEQGKFGRLCKI